MYRDSGVKCTGTEIKEHKAIRDKFTGTNVYGQRYRDESKSGALYKDTYLDKVQE